MGLELKVTNLKTIPTTNHWTILERRFVDSDRHYGAVATSICASSETLAEPVVRRGLQRA